MTQAATKTLHQKILMLELIRLLQLFAENTRSNTKVLANT